MAMRSALKMDFRNKTDQVIIEAFCTSIVVKNFEKIQRLDYQMKHGLYMDTKDGVDTFFASLSPEITNDLRKGLQKSSKRAYELLNDVKGDKNSQELTPLQTYLYNYKVPKDKTAQRTFANLKGISQSDQNFISAYASSSVEQRQNMRLTKEQKRLLKDFSSIPTKSQQTLLDLYDLSPVTQNALYLSEKYTRKKILKSTQENLPTSKREEGKYTLTDFDIASIERKAMGHNINIDKLRTQTAARYTSEKNSVQKIITSRTALALISFSLLIGTINVGSKTIEDINNIMKTNNQTFINLYENGFTNVDFDISPETLTSILNIQNALDQYAVKEPSYDQQLELMDSMSQTYKNIINEKAHAAFSEAYPNTDVINLNFTDSEIMISYLENGTVSNKTFNVKDIMFQKANLSDIMQSFSSIQQLKTEAEKDKQTQADIDVAISNGLYSSSSTEYQLTESIESRVGKLSNLHELVSNATATDLKIRKNIISKDQFVSTPQGKTPSEVTSESTTTEKSVEENVTTNENDKTDFFTLDQFKKNDVLTHLKGFYAQEYNLANPSKLISSYDISITKPEQNYTFLVTAGEKTYIMTHGSDPQSTKEFLDAETQKGTLSYSVTGTVPITQVVKSVSNVYDDNGNPQTSVMLDGAAYYEGAIYPVVSGNFHDTVLNPEYESILSNPNIYSASQAMFEVKTPYSTTDYYINNAKTKYAESLNKYCESKGYSAEDISSNLLANSDKDDYDR